VRINEALTGASLSAAFAAGEQLPWAEEDTEEEAEEQEQEQEEQFSHGAETVLDRIDPLEMPQDTVIARRASRTPACWLA
jgi:hypothetical protein